MSELTTRLDALQHYVAQRRTLAQQQHLQPGQTKLQLSSASSSALGHAGLGEDDDLLRSVQGISHGDAVVESLKRQVMSFTGSLKAVLNIRTENLKAQANRRQALGGVRDLGRPMPATPTPPPASNALPRGAPGSGSAFASPAAIRMLDAADRGGLHTGDAVISVRGAHVSDSLLRAGSGSARGNADGNAAGSPFMQVTQMQLGADTQYLSARSQDVHAIERHVNDLSEMFSRLASVVSEQGALVERIDDNVSAAGADVEAGTIELNRAWHRVSSNRILMLKVAAILFVFLIFFLTFIV